jgi:predicted transposase/invertase (TIGR01784 family)
MVRHFPENGMKVLLEDPRNVRDLLALANNDLVNLIDFDNLSHVRTTFVARDFRHVEADVVLTAPIREDAAARGQKRLWLYVLIEHQSKPDQFMILRLLEYVVQLYKAQRRRMGGRGSLLQPVLPVVFYTGLERWDAIASLAELVALGERFRPVTPHLSPLFLNLRSFRLDELAAKGGSFGSVLQLVRDRRVRVREFRGFLEQALRTLERMPVTERARWLDLLSYLLALVYHERHAAEHRPLQEVIEASVQTDRERQEIRHVSQTIAQMLEAKGRKQGRKEGREAGREEGRKEGELKALREALTRNLRSAFPDVPAGTLRTIQQVEDVGQLNAWLDRLRTARKLADVGIPVK